MLVTFGTPRTFIHSNIQSLDRIVAVKAMGVDYSTPLALRA
jgi:hypothetical protein